jgi:uncharacterized protein with NRDE domain
VPDRAIPRLRHTVCTLALYFGLAEDVPVLVAANRDEYLVRPTAAPQVISTAPWVVAGQDLEAGGTWLGLNERGMVVGVLNRQSPRGPDPGRRSRGLLCLETLQQPDAAAARAYLAAARGDDYNGFNLLIATTTTAFVATPRGDRVTIRDLEPAIHLLTNLELNDPTCPRIAKSHRLFAGLTLPSSDRIDKILPPLRAILSDHSTPLDPRATTIENLCVHRGPYGTRSSTIIALPRRGPPRYWHAAGPPCECQYRPIELPA